MCDYHFSFKKVLTGEQPLGLTAEFLAHAAKAQKQDPLPVLHSSTFSNPALAKEQPPCFIDGQRLLSPFFFVRRLNESGDLFSASSRHLPTSQPCRVWQFSWIGRPLSGKAHGRNSRGCRCFGRVRRCGPGTVCPHDVWLDSEMTAFSRLL